MRVLFILLFITAFSFGQSKKEQIVLLINKVDSLIFEIKKTSNKIDSVKTLTIEQIKFQQQERINNRNSFETKKNNLESDIINLKLLIRNNEAIKNQIINEINNINGSIRYINNEIDKIDLKIQISKYNTVLINNQEWMDFDLDVKTFLNGDSIIQAKSENEWKELNEQKKSCYMKLKNATFVYNGYAIIDKRGLIPKGFRLPTKHDFDTLLGFSPNAIRYMVENIATYSFIIPSYNRSNGETVKCNNSYKFNAKKGGFVYPDGTINDGDCTYWWTSSIENNNFIVVDIGYCSQGMGGGSGSHDLNYGFTVRCIK
jgi:uncharacterized protein (TIGR02145 family)